MSFNSYAQNFEDVMLWRALGNVEHGFYIDIGAQDPIVDSVSLAFHERGWQGIHVEPTPYYAELLRQQRPQDTVLQAAVVESSVILKFFEIPNTGISTADPIIAARHRERGFDVREITVPSITLSEIFNFCSGKEIHWLKIDVEGFEKQVLLSWGESAMRPWIVIVESTLPLTQIETYESWEDLIINYGYTYVYFDGLNRYYIANTHPELKSAFSSPPNVFDDFTLNGTASAPFHQLIKWRHQELLKQMNEEKHSVESEIENLRQSLEALNDTHATQNRLGQQALESQLNHQAQRDQEISAQLLALRQEASEGKAEIARLQSIQELDLRERHIDFERELFQQIQAAHQDLQRQKQEAEGRDKLLLEHIKQAQHALEDNLRRQALREQEISTQLLTLNQQATCGKNEVARLHDEQTRVLHTLNAERERIFTQYQAGQQELRRQQEDWAQREQELTKKINLVQQSLENHLRNQALREQEIAEQLLGMQKHSAQAMTEITQSYSDQIREIQLEHTKWVQIHSQELEIKEQKLRQMEQTRTELEYQFSEKLKNERESFNKLEQIFAALQVELENTRNSLSWRITAPFLKITSLFFKPAVMTANSPNVAPAATSKGDSTHFEEQRLISNQTPSEISIMTVDRLIRNKPAAPLRAATSLKALLQLNDRMFVECAYLTLLRCQPDAQGLDYYLGRIRNGVSKIQVLGQLLDSPQARANGVNLPGLRKAVKHEKLVRVPFLGNIFKLFTSVGGNSDFEIRLRSIEQQIFLLEQKSDFHHTQIEENLQDLKKIIERKLENSYSTISQDSAAEKTIQTEKTEYIKSSSILSKTITLENNTATDAIKQLGEALNKSLEAQQLYIQR